MQQKNTKLRRVAFAVTLFALLAVLFVWWLLPKQPLLQFAARRGNAALVKLALFGGADPKLQEKHGFNIVGVPVRDEAVLALAVKSGSLDAVSALLNHGADIDVTDFDLLTPVGLAVKRDDLEMLKLLRSRGAKLAVCGQHTTSMHMTALSGQYPIAEYLLHGRGGVSIDVVDAIGYTALCRAVEFGNVSALQFLLKHGADPGVRCMGFERKHGEVQKMPLEWVRDEIVRRAAEQQRMRQRVRKLDIVMQRDFDAAEKHLQNLREVERILAAAAPKGP